MVFFGATETGSQTPYFYLSIERMSGHKGVPVGIKMMTTVAIAIECRSSPFVHFGSITGESCILVQL